METAQWSGPWEYSGRFKPAQASQPFLGGRQHKTPMAEEKICAKQAPGHETSVQGMVKAAGGTSVSGCESPQCEEHLEKRVRMAKTSTNPSTCWLPAQRGSVGRQRRLLCHLFLMLAVMGAARTVLSPSPRSRSLSLEK